MVHDHDALAQVLHDVLRELGHVGEVHLLAAHRGFGIAQAARDRPGEQRHQEDDAAQDAGGGVVVDVRAAQHVAADLLREQGEGCEGRQQEGIAAVRQQRHGADRHHEQDAHAARDAAAREHEQAYGNGIDHGVHESGGTQVGEQAPPADHDGHAGGEIDDQHPQEQLRPGAAERRGAPEKT